MKPRNSSFVILSFAFLFTVSAYAQQTPYVVGSTVTGHVICNDTSAPAHFAKVLMKPVSGDNAGADFIQELQKSMQKDAGGAAKPPTEDQKRALAAAARGMNKASEMLNSSTVGLDGSYSFAGVKAGTYYVHAIYAGYIDPYSEFSEEDLVSADPAVRARIAAKVTTVTVSGTDSARAELRLERGAAISGRLVYDDGSPAAGWMLTVMKPKSVESPEDMTSLMMAQALSLSGMGQSAKTDDLGHYRIAGFESGEYVVRAVLISSPTGISATNIGDGGSGINLSVYSGNTFTRSEAKTVNVAAGDERSGVDITIPSSHLHNVVGHVYAKSDGHTLNMGEVELSSKANAALHLRAAIRDDGSFHFEYLPGNITYTLTVAEAADGRTTQTESKILGISIPKQEVLHRYGSDTKDVMLNDEDVDSIRMNVGVVDAEQK